VNETLWYGLDGQPISIEQASQLLASPERILAKTLLTTGRDPVEVSTVFLVLDHGLGDDSVPVLWETMTFGGPDDGAQRRYTSREAAIAGHYEQLTVSRAALDVAGIQVLAEHHHAIPRDSPG
jgi:hypothetical protein